MLELKQLIIDLFAQLLQENPELIQLLKGPEAVVSVKQKIGIYGSVVMESQWELHGNWIWMPCEAASGVWS